MSMASDGGIAGNQAALKEAGLEERSEAGYGSYPAGIVATLKKIEKKNQVPMTGVNIKMNSSLPAQLDAKAVSYGGRQVELGPGQESSINHELGHIVQQRLGMVKATGTIGGWKVNTDQALEKDATQRGMV